jgi:uncharacterized tellurite resistance protein B-like protein
MSLIQTLIGFLREGGIGPDRGLPQDVPEEDLAAAALLVHVARVDGTFADGEKQALLAFLRSSYGFDRDDAETLLGRADRLDRQADDVGSLVEALGHEGHGPDRIRLLEGAYRIAVADGGLGEFEEDLLWRLGHLLGFDDDTVARIRAGSIGAGFVAAAIES